MTGKSVEKSKPAASPNQRPFSKMPHMVTRFPISDLNQHLTCALCSGYMIDATTVVECLHSFCRSCLLRYLETSTTCPICDTQINKAQLDKCVRADHTLQDLVYKLVPGLYKSELRRRKDFYLEQCKSASDDASTSKSDSLANGGMQIFDKHLVELSAFICTPDEIISFSLETTPKKPQTSDSTGKINASANESNSIETRSNSSQQQKPTKDGASKNEELHFKRYFRCPAAVTVGHLKKLLAYKMDLSSAHQVEILHSDEPLLDEYTLMDIAYIYTWRRKAPMQLFFNVCKYETEDEPMPLLVPEIIASSSGADQGSPRLVDTTPMSCEPVTQNGTTKPGLSISVDFGPAVTTQPNLDVKKDLPPAQDFAAPAISVITNSIAVPVVKKIAQSAARPYATTQTTEASMRGKPPLPIYRTDPGPFIVQRPVVSNCPSNGLGRPRPPPLTNGKLIPIRLALPSFANGERKKPKSDGVTTPKPRKASQPKPPKQPKLIRSPPDILAALQKITGILPATATASIASATVPLSTSLVSGNRVDTLMDTGHSPNSMSHDEPSPPGAYKPTAAQSACTQPAKLRLKKSLSSVVQELSSNALEACAPSKRVKLEDGEEEMEARREAPLIH